MMILTNVIRIIIFFLSCLFIFISLKRDVKKKNIKFIYVILFLFTFGANYLLGFVPALTEEIKLTALGTKNSNALSEELFLDSYTVDGTIFSAGKHLDISSGQWFWSGETYCWRSDLDSRRPNNITKTVIINIPVGLERTINFSTGIWCGQLEINNGQEKFIIDTYSENTGIMEVQIGGSSKSLLFFNQMRYLIIYLLLETFICFFIILFCKKILNKDCNLRQKVKNHYSKLVYLSIALLSFIVMIHYADRTSFWSDELYQIYFTHNTIYDAIQHCLKMYECSPPLALIYATLWYHIAPYGETWLLLSDIVPTIISIYFVGLIGEKIAGKYCGTISASLLAFSTTVWQNVAYEYRAYAFMLLFSTLSLYCYIRRNEHPEKKIFAVLFTGSLICLAMSHYFGMIAGAFYFLADVYLWRKGYTKITTVFTYVFWGIVNLAWLGCVLTNVGQMLGGGMWYDIPGIFNIRSLLYFLVGNNELIYWIFILGVAYGLVLILNKRNNNIVWEDFYNIFSVLTIIGTILLLFFYGNYVNTKSTLWSERYFLFLIPFVCVVFSLSFSKFTAIYNNELIKKSFCLFLIMFLSLNCFVYVSNSNSAYPYREVADYVYTDINYIFNEDTVIIGTSVWMVMDAWNEYYISRQGRREPLNVVSQYEISEEQILQYDRIYLEYIHISAEPWLISLLDENYDLEIDRADLKLKVYVRK